MAYKMDIISVESLTKNFMQTHVIKSILKLSRWNEYYGKAFLISVLAISLSPNTSVLQGVYLVLANLFSNAFSFMINDVEDSEDDALDANKRKRNAISANMITRRAGYALSILTALLSMLFYTLLGPIPAALGFSGLLLGFMYSWKVTRLKSKPLIDILSHGLFLGALQFYVGTFNSQTDPFMINMIGLSIFTLSALGDVSNEIRDYEVDMKAGLKNTASIIKLTVIGPFLPYLTIIPIIPIYGYAIIEATDPIRLLLIISTITIAVHYLLTEHKRKGDLYAYRYRHISFTLLSILILL